MFGRKNEVTSFNPCSRANQNVPSQIRIFFYKHPASSARNGTSWGKKGHFSTQKAALLSSKSTASLLLIIYLTDYQYVINCLKIITNLFYIHRLKDVTEAYQISVSNKKSDVSLLLCRYNIELSCGLEVEHPLVGNDMVVEGLDSERVTAFRHVHRRQLQGLTAQDALLPEL